MIRRGRRDRRRVGLRGELFEEVGVGGGEVENDEAGLVVGDHTLGQVAVCRVGLASPGAHPGSTVPKAAVLTRTRVPPLSSPAGADPATQTTPGPEVNATGLSPTLMLPTTAKRSGLMRETVPEYWLATQMAPWLATNAVGAAAYGNGAYHCKGRRVHHRFPEFATRAR